MPEPTFDVDGYPTDETLDVIKKWDYDSVSGFLPLMDYIEKAWKWGDEYFTKEDNGDHVAYELHTVGWSGNEGLIGALQDNPLFWAMCWHESRRGGHYKFVANRPLQSRVAAT